MKVVLATVGSRGDVQPMVAIAQALAARGHRPVVAAPPDFGPWVRDLGFDFEGLGMDVNAFMQEHRKTLGANILGFFKVARRMFDEQLPAQMDTLLRVGRDADAIVFAAGSVTASSAGEKLGIPALGVLFTTAVLPSADHAPVLLPWRTAPRWMNRLLWRLSDPMWNVLLKRGLNAARAHHGLAPVKDVVEHLYGDAGFVLAVDGSIMPADPQWADRIPPVGFLFLEPSETHLDAGLEAWLREGEPPVYVGFGSMTGEGPERMGRIVVDAVEANGRRGLVSRGWAGLGEALPRGWRAVGEVPHELLFPRMACVVHHGGSGTMAAALRAGVPQVVAPLILDQYHHAEMLWRAGLAPRATPMERMTAERLARAIAEAVALPPSPRVRIADRLRSSDAAGEIARRIEALAA